jgi:hypothetical protein
MSFRQWWIDGVLQDFKETNQKKPNWAREGF